MSSCFQTKYKPVLISVSVFFFERTSQLNTMTPLIRDNNNQSIIKSFSQGVNQSVHLAISQSVSQSVGWLVGQSVHPEIDATTKNINGKFGKLGTTNVAKMTILAESPTTWKQMYEVM